MEERWEAVEVCERLFAAADVRASSVHVGLARTAGVELIRIGAAQRDELANWRYGPRLRRRRRRATLLRASAGAAGVAIMGGGAAAAGATTGSLIAGGYAAIIAAGWAVTLVRRVGPVAGTRFVGPDGERVTLARSAVDGVRLLRRSSAEGSRTLGAVVGLEGQELRYWSAAALPLLAAVLPRLNWRGAAEAELREATRVVDKVEVAAARKERRGGTPLPPWQQVAFAHWPEGDRMALMAPVTRFAFEMAVTEELERRALAGDADALTGRWREAEEVAHIADNMFLPAFVTDWLARHQRADGGGASSKDGSAT
jgi:hypothetical protein